MKERAQRSDAGNLPAARRWLGLAAAGLALAGCVGSAQTAADVVARLDGEEVPYERFERYLESNVDGDETGSQELDDAVASRLFDRFLDQQLLVRLAADRGFDGDGADERPAIDFLLRQAAAEGVEPRHVAAYYEANKERWQQPPQVRLWQILVPERAQAEAAKRALDAGRSFRELALELAQDPDAGFCGEQGLLAREDLPPPFADAIFALAPGEHTGVLTADYGYYLFMVEERLPARVPTLAEVEGEIRDLLLRQRMDALMTDLLGEARARYTVRVFPANLPFVYRGSYADAEQTDE
ncbi:MAG: peptidyl-prolyl cis-trans isomerase [Acidobacteria bacterium]|nr:MAG: peptidyl-prolyl cis-trans isomerase [Acidobacteriota bacterium]